MFFGSEIVNVIAAIWPHVTLYIWGNYSDQTAGWSPQNGGLVRESPKKCP